MPQDLLSRSVRAMEARLAEIKPLADEVPRLEAALAALQGNGASERRRSASSAAAGRTAQPSKPRAPRGANRQKILAEIGNRPGASAGEIANATRIRKTVTYTTIAKLKKDGLVKSEDGGLALTGQGPGLFAST